ncbi:NAD(P)-binding protein [Parathielavia appendiculata]|uniref:NAD(P)-binding protein n=1 Tax=Parathielavia appendiculata TaxID=2587402 RepID=A0AAN6TQM2_9PEZI|nr:NAD(P)-binding protein [Parathielavia appendiculata]
MSGTITRVALAGATGNLGPAILKQLLAANFQVTVLTRASSTTTTTKHSFPPSVRVAPVDYDSLGSLVAALRGQDAVVSTLTSAALSKQLLLVEAAAQAGVKRFIPSDFGSNTVHPRVAALPSYADKVAVQKSLQAKAAAEPGAASLTYTIVLNGPFLDWGLEVGFVLDVKNRRATLYDGGDRVFSATTLPTVGKAVAAVLRKPDETRNRAVYVHDTATTLRKLYDMARKATPGEKWTEEVVSVDGLVAQAWDELTKENPDPEKFVMKFISAAIWGEGYGAHFETTDNELVGIREHTEDEVQAVVQRYV